MRLDIGMNKSQVEQFRNRWQAVEAIQLEEMRSATLELRWRQLNAAYGMGSSLQLSSGHSDEAQVYQRWAKLNENVCFRNTQKTTRLESTIIGKE